MIASRFLPSLVLPKAWIRTSFFFSFFPNFGQSRERLLLPFNVRFSALLLADSSIPPPSPPPPPAASPPSPSLFPARVTSLHVLPVPHTRAQTPSFSTLSHLLFSQVEEAQEHMPVSEEIHGEAEGAR